MAAGPTALTPPARKPAVKSQAGLGLRAQAQAARDRLGRADRDRRPDPVRPGADAGAVQLQRLVDHLPALGGLHDQVVRGRLRRERRPRGGPQLGDRRHDRDGLLAGARHAGRLGPDPAAVPRSRRDRRRPRRGPRRAVADHRRRRPHLLQRVRDRPLAQDGDRDAPRRHLPARRRDHLRRPRPLPALAGGGGGRPRRQPAADAALRRPAADRARRSRPRRSSPSPGASTTSRSRSSSAASTRRSRSGSSRSCASPRTCRSSTRSRR